MHSQVQIVVNETTHHSNLTSIGRVRTWQTGKKIRVTKVKVAAANLAAVVARVVDRSPVIARVVAVPPVDSVAAVAVVATADTSVS